MNKINSTVWAAWIPIPWSIHAKGSTRSKQLITPHTFHTKGWTRSWLIKHIVSRVVHHFVLISRVHSLTCSGNWLIISQILLKNVNRSHVVVWWWVWWRIIEDSRAEGTVHIPAGRETAASLLTEILMTYLLVPHLVVLKATFCPCGKTKWQTINDMFYQLFRLSSIFWVDIFFFFFKSTHFLCAGKLLATTCIASCLNQWHQLSLISLPLVPSASSTNQLHDQRPVLV